MCGRFYLDTTHADHANLIMRYLSIRWSDSETGKTIVTIRILRSFLWYAMNELMHTIHEQINACDARTKWCMRWKFFFLVHGWSLQTIFLIKSWVQTRVSTPLLSDCPFYSHASKLIYDKNQQSITKLFN